MAEVGMSRDEMQEALAQLQYLQNVYTQRYEILTEQITTYNVARDAVLRSIELIGRITTLNDSSVLVNTDGGTYIEASIKKVDRIITYVGAGYLIEKSTQDAKSFLESTVKAGDGSINKLVSDRQKLEKELYDISYRLAAFRQA